MPLISYVEKRFNSKSKALIEKANEIINEYAERGYDLTLRQLYYQFVSRDILPNTVKSYGLLGRVVNDGRLAGLIDWDRIVDRTRNLHQLANWRSPSQIVSACADQFRIDKWKTQPVRIEVWIEKEALAGVFERVCDELQIPFLSCRGYTSQSEMWGGAQRLQRIVKGKQNAIILHFGDHDPSGIDMTRDIVDRLNLFMAGVKLERLALNMDQVDQYQPPPNPAKTTDTRFQAYIRDYGDQSWELDALDPDVLANLVRDFVTSVRDEDKWAEAEEEEAEHRRLLTEVASNWNELTGSL